MPKPKRFRKLLKSVVGTSSPTTFSLEACAQHNSTPMDPSHSTLQMPEACHSAPIAPATLQPLTPMGPAYTPQQPQGYPSPPIAPATSHSSDLGSAQSTHHETPSASKRKCGRESNHYWSVDAIDEENGVTKKLKLKVRDVHNLPSGMRIVVNFDSNFSPIGEVAGLLAGVCGLMATDCLLFPISFEKWSSIPDTFFNRQWDTVLKSRFFFKVNEQIAKRFVEQSIGKKWKEHRLKLWDDAFNPLRSKDEIVNDVPDSVSMDQWALFVDYRMKPETMELCKRNKENRQKQTIPHTSGAKSIARRKAELEMETGKNVSRGAMWNITHKRKDGSFVNDEAREIGEKIVHISQTSGDSSEISPNDAVGIVLGKEHPGRVRGLGMGVVPTIAFRHTTTRLGGINLGPSTASSSAILQEKVTNMESQLQALYAYISMKEGGKIPQELACMFPTPPQT